MSDIDVDLTEDEKRILRAWRDGAKINDDVRQATGLSRQQIQSAYNRFNIIFGTYNMKEQATCADQSGLL